MSRRLCIVMLLFFGWSCREKYESAHATPTTGYLVVEGLVNTTGTTVIKLSRTSKLAERGVVAELGATVAVNGEDGSAWSFTAADSGRYTSPQLPLITGVKYRLKVMTHDSKQYASDFRRLLVSQLIDSISYASVGDGVQFYINSTVAQPQQYYFKYDYEETWSFHSSFRTRLKIDTIFTAGIPSYSVDYYQLSHDFNDSIYRCWQSRISHQINIGTTEKLTQSRIFLPVQFIKRNALALSDVYSMLVRQYALSKEGYEFYKKMKKNSESLGSIFDAQPSELVGNITCESNPGELVIGFVEFSSAEEKRIFVDAQNLPGTPYDAGCETFGGFGIRFNYPFDNNTQVITYAVDTLDLLPTFAARTNPQIETFTAERAICVDCTLRGSNIKPSFWP